MDVSDLRREYMLAGLAESDLAPEPMVQFGVWFEQAAATQSLDPTAMTLATADRQGRPSARVVLLKGYDESGFVFFTNYASRKGHELEANPRAALVFHWPALDRQVRAEGPVERIPAADSAAYFASRPVPSQIGAWASHQSEPIESREALERRFTEIADRCAAGPVPAPDFWGGYRLRPDRVEFWQGRPSRLHDRLVYCRGAGSSGGAWTVERLQP
jgi:pyridoxamine 5'-phosphate oxidase